MKKADLLADLNTPILTNLRGFFNLASNFIEVIKYLLTFWTLIQLKLYSC